MSDAAVEPPPQVQALSVGGEEDRARPKKRRRVVVSCTECHRRKQKCDRGLPCSNCRSRNKEAACTYEAGAPTAKRTDGKPSSPESADGPAPDGERTVQGNMTRVPVSALIEAPEGSTSAALRASDGGGDALSSMAADWGYSNTSTSTMGFLRTIEAADADADGTRPSLSSLVPRNSSAAVREKFKNLIRQLPTRVHLDKLVHIYMTTLNWHYYIVDAALFEQQLEEWNSLSFKQLKAAPEGLSRDLQVFPAVLFQMAATSLLSLDERPDPDFDALKYAGNMTFEDLAVEYSEVGAAIVNLFGKKDLSVTSIQAEFLRASFLKFTKNVTESWHAVAITIRDAQELGMHKDSLDPKPKDSSAEAALENQWHIEQRRRLYGLLAVWDVHMSLILARPGVIDWRNPLPTPPVDVRQTKDLSRTPVMPRDPERDPPTPTTSLLWMLRLLGRLREILDMEKEGACPKDFVKVDRIHQSLLDLEETKPAILRTENPDTRWDHLPELYWLPYKRAYYGGLVQFSIMALHRPYIFHRRASREAALVSGINMLEAQRQSFEGLPPQSWRNYHLFFGSFDGVVLIATIFILFPREHTELRSSALQQFQWTIERFGAMQDRNPYARSGLGILKAILAKLTRTIDSEPSPMSASVSASVSAYGAAATDTPATSWSRDAPSGSTPSTTGGSAGGGVRSSLGAGPIDSQAQTSTPDYGVSNGGSGSDGNTANFNDATAAAAAAAADWTMFDSDALASLAPLFPTSDLIFNDLNAIFDTNSGGQFSGHLEDAAVAGAGVMGGNTGNIDEGGGNGNGNGNGNGELLEPNMAFPAQFGGGFGEDTVWQLLNQYQPGTSV